MLFRLFWYCQVSNITIDSLFAFFIHFTLFVFIILSSWFYDMPYIFIRLISIHINYNSTFKISHYLLLRSCWVVLFFYLWSIKYLLMQQTIQNLSHAKKPLDMKGMMVIFHLLSNRRCFFSIYKQYCNNIFNGMWQKRQFMNACR